MKLAQSPRVKKFPNFYHQPFFPHDLSVVYLFQKHPEIHQNLLHVKLGLQFMVLLAHTLLSAL